MDAGLNEEGAEPEIQVLDRPYGHQELLMLNAVSTVKIISVAPGFRLSLHRHEKRDEWWTVLDVPLDVHVDGRAWTAEPGARVWIPRGLTHCIGNPGTAPGRFLEIALGLFDENDIERLDEGCP